MVHTRTTHTSHTTQVVVVGAVASRALVSTVANNLNELGWIALGYSKPIYVTFMNVESNRRQAQVGLLLVDPVGFPFQIYAHDGRQVA